MASISCQYPGCYYVATADSEHLAVAKLYSHTTYHFISPSTVYLQRYFPSSYCILSSLFPYYVEPFPINFLIFDF